MWGPCAPRRHQTSTACSLDLWLRYKSKAVDLAGLNRVCKVKLKCRDGLSRAEEGTLEVHPSLVFSGIYSGVR
jgi:hypothetical protein